MVEGIISLTCDTFLTRNCIVKKIIPLQICLIVIWMFFGEITIWSNYGDVYRAVRCVRFKFWFSWVYKHDVDNALFRFKSDGLKYRLSHIAGKSVVLPTEQGTGTAIATVSVSSQVQCATMCMVNGECESAQYDTNTHECFLLDSDGHTSSNNSNCVFLLI